MFTKKKILPDTRFYKQHPLLIKKISIKKLKTTRTEWALAILINLCEKQASFTVKDSRDVFRPSFCVINPTKTELGIISWEITQNIYELLRVATQVNQ